MLKIQNMSCGYPDKLILQDINLETRNGEFTAIIGPNGSGKTTLTRAITKIIKPSSGKIFIEDKDITLMTHGEIARKIAVVSQHSDMEINMTVEEVVLSGRIPFRERYRFLDTKEDINIAEKAMALTGTGSIRGRPINQLSGGEKQLVFIASALAQEPRLLILDEPTAHLDIAHQVLILDLMRKLNRENNLSIFAVLHDLNIAAEYCDRIVLLNRGHIHKTGIPSEVLTYQIIEEVYKTVVVVRQNPISGKPFVIAVSGQNLKN